MSRENKALVAFISAIAICLLVAIVVAINSPSAPSQSKPTSVISTSVNFPTATKEPAAPPPASKEVYVDGEKLMMPFGKPELVTFCYKGFRMFYGFYDTRSYGGVTQTLWGTADPKCPQE